MHAKKKVIVDTGYLVALFNEKDKFHEQALAAEEYLGDDFEFVTTVFVVQETCWLLANRAGKDKMIQFMQLLSEGGFLTIEDLDNKWIEKTKKVIEKFSDRNVDLADASLVILADQLNTGQILTVDKKDFAILRWNGGKNSFTNLLELFSEE
jgi:uncharacterized protein